MKAFGPVAHGLYEITSGMGSYAWLFVDGY
jgi:hypothetical protein